ncbi:MAG: hypothetical protein DRG25_06570, partial [Deltaproteobacteria bacterium]
MAFDYIKFFKPKNILLEYKIVKKKIQLKNRCYSDVKMSPRLNFSVLEEVIFWMTPCFEIDARRMTFPN